MKHILTIGHQHFVLPESANVNTLLKTLSQAKAVRWDYLKEKRGQDRYIYIIEDERPEIEVKLVKNECVIDPNKCRAIPQRVPTHPDELR